MCINRSNTVLILWYLFSVSPQQRNKLPMTIVAVALNKCQNRNKTLWFFTANFQKLFSWVWSRLNKIVQRTLITMVKLKFNATRSLIEPIFLLLYRISTWKVIKQVASKGTYTINWATERDMKRREEAQTSIYVRNGCVNTCAEIEE